MIWSSLYLSKWYINSGVNLSVEKIVLEEMKAMVKAKDMCVMATVSRGTPHCSLMTYVCDDECQEIYMITQKNTQKYKNLLENPTVSLLIDSREEHTGSSRRNAKAMTISGTFHKIENNSEKKEAGNRLLERHPHLEVFFDDPDTEVFCVSVSSFLLLDGLKEAYFEKV
jgi:nitroimidazol reductase NimA-like FMN-containing flavoprotein (pyridoxamine 5'-phosphate oxidase superfamily)